MGSQKEIRSVIVPCNTPTHLSPEMPPGPTSPGQGSDQDGGVDTHSSESRHAPSPTSSDASCWTRMEEWTPTFLSPEMPPGPTSPVQGSDLDGGGVLRSGHFSFLMYLTHHTYVPEPP